MVSEIHIKRQQGNCYIVSLIFVFMSIFNNCVIWLVFRGLVDFEGSIL